VNFRFVSVLKIGGPGLPFMDHGTGPVHGGPRPLPAEELVEAHDCGCFRMRGPSWRGYRWRGGPGEARQCQGRVVRWSRCPGGEGLWWR
jgi:hypothetical protein